MKFSLIHNKIVGWYAKNWIFYQNNIMQYYVLFKVSAWLSNHTAVKIGLTEEQGMRALAQPPTPPDS
jgi:hypothetical protein